MSTDDIETVNPYDDPEKQALEQKLENDTHVLHQTHQTLVQERDLDQQAQTAGYPTTNTDARIQQLEHSEQVMSATVTGDQQAIDHWDQAHPDGSSHHDQGGGQSDGGSTLYAGADPSGGAQDGSGGYADASYGDQSYGDQSYGGDQAYADQSYGGDQSYGDQSYSTGDDSVA